MTPTDQDEHKDKNKENSDNCKQECGNFVCTLYRQRVLREFKKEKNRVLYKDLSKQQKNFKARVADKKKEFERTLWFFETKMLMHRLSIEYYHYRAKWLTFFPILLVTSLTSVVGFISSTEFISEDLMNALALTSGVLGVLSTALASCAKYNNYQSIADMHHSAFDSISTIVDRVRLDLLSFQMLTKSIDKDLDSFEMLDNTISDPNPNPDNKESVKAAINIEKPVNEVMQTEEKNQTETVIKNFKEFGVSLDAYRAEYETMKKIFNMHFPAPIQMPFDNLRHILEPANHDILKYLYPRLYYFLCDSIKSHKYFPLKVAYVDIKKMCEKELGCEIKMICKPPRPMLFYDIELTNDMESQRGQGSVGSRSPSPVINDL